MTCEIWDAQGHYTVTGSQNPALSFCWSLGRGHGINTSEQSNSSPKPDWVLWCYGWFGKGHPVSILCHESNSASSSMQLHMESTRCKEQPKRL